MDGAGLEAFERLKHSMVTLRHRGHSRFLRTYKRSTGELYWPNMNAVVKEYAEKCLVCQHNKLEVLSPAGLLQPLLAPNEFGRTRLWIL